MMSVTHAAIAICTTSIALGTANPFVLGIAALGSQLPDLDTTQSFTGRVLYPAAAWLEARFPHRTITHSFAASAVVAVAGSPLLLFHHPHYWLAVVLGHFMGWFSDCFTKAGVTAFYPNPARLVIPGNPNARLTSKSSAEYWILALALFLTVCTVNVVSQGNITEQFARSLFTDSSTAAEMFRKYGSQQAITIEVSGIHARTSESIAQHFTVIDATEHDVIAEEAISQKLFKIGTAPDVQIRPIRVKTTLGDRLSIQTQEMVLEEVEAADWLEQVPDDAYVTGVLTLDRSDVVVSPELETYPTIRQSGSSIELSHARPKQLRVLGESWIVNGKVLLKQRQ